MSMMTKALLGVAAFVLLLSITAVGCVIGVKNDCVRQEAGITAQYSQDQNNYASYFNKIKEMAQIPDMYTADLMKLFDKAMSKRYGENGSKAMWQFIQEHNPTIDASLYTSIQQAIEAGRNSFEADQKTLLDKKRVYEIALNTFPNGSIAHMFGYPRLDLAKYDIVINDETQKAFDTKRAEPISVRP